MAFVCIKLFGSCCRFCFRWDKNPKDETENEDENENANANVDDDARLVRCLKLNNARSFGFMTFR